MHARMTNNFHPNERAWPIIEARIQSVAVHPRGREIEIFMFANLFFQSRAVKPVQRKTLQSALLSRNAHGNVSFSFRWDKRVLEEQREKPSKTSNDENVLVRQAAHVPSEGPARYRSSGGFHYATFLTWNIQMRIGLDIT